MMMELLVGSVWGRVESSFSSSGIHPTSPHFQPASQRRVAMVEETASLRLLSLLVACFVVRTPKDMCVWKWISWLFHCRPYVIQYVLAARWPILLVLYVATVYFKTHLLYCTVRTVYIDYSLIPDMSFESSTQVGFYVMCGTHIS